MCLQNCKKSQNSDLNDEHEALKLQQWDLTSDFLYNSDYIDLDNCVNIEIQNPDLCVLQLNVRGLIGKQQQLSDLLCKCTKKGKVDVIILIETWLTKESASRINMPGYTYVGKIRKAKKGGGVGFLVRNNLVYKTRNDLDWKIEEYESCFIEIKSNLRNIICGALYRPPNTKAKQFVDEYQNCSRKLQTEKNKSFIIGMDHNLDLLKHESYSPTQMLLEIMAESNHFPCIMRPTRITSHSATLIDNIVVSADLYKKQECSIIIHDISDHLPCIMKISGCLKNDRNAQITYKCNLSTKNIEELKHRLDSINWVDELKQQNSDDGMNLFHSKLISIMNDVCPERPHNVSTNRNIKEAWMTPGLLRCSKTQLKLYKAYLTKKDRCSEIKYKTYRDELKRIKRSCRCSFYLEKCTELKNNTKKMWQLINGIINKNNDKRCVIGLLTVNNLETANSKDIVNGLADHFSSVGKQFASSMGTSNKTITEYNNKIPKNSKSLLLYPTTEIEIGSIIDKMIAKQSSGWDGISNKLIKNLKSSLITPLNILFNQSMSEGIFPNIMKTALVTPLHKSGKKSIRTNYRPISLLITISKILEKLIYHHTYNFLTKTNQFYQSQYGFRKKHSCENAIQELLGTVLKGFENNEYTCAVFLDLSKAFDSLEHQILIEKLSLYGIRGIALEWFQSYLTDRRLRVKCPAGEPTEHCISDEYDITHGVPQGSILGPLLFLVYCNDLPLVLESINSILFADDTTLYKKHSNLNYLMWCMSEELKRLMDWFVANKLSLNLKKSVCMLFNERNPASNFTIQIGDIVLPSVECTKFLGVWIDSKLNWKTHIAKLYIKLKQNINLLKTGKNHLNLHAKKLVYYGHIHSHINYCLSVWGNNVANGIVNKLTGIQMKCISLISKHKNRKELGILTVNELIELENMKFGYKLKNNLLPTEISHCAKHDHKGNNLTKTHRYDTRNKDVPNIPTVKNRKYLSSIFCKGTIALLRVPDTIKCLMNYNSFVTSCKKLLLS